MMELICTNGHSYKGQSCSRCGCVAQVEVVKKTKVSKKKKTTSKKKVNKKTLKKVVKKVLKRITKKKETKNK